MRQWSDEPKGNSDVMIEKNKEMEERIKSDVCTIAKRTAEEGNEVHQ